MAKTNNKWCPQHDSNTRDAVQETEEHNINHSNALQGNLL